MIGYSLPMKNWVLGFFISIIFALTANIAMAAHSWPELTQKAITQGERSEGYAGIYKTLRLIQAIGHQGAYEADYFSAVGGESDGGVFSAGHYETVSEVWLIDQDGNWDINQWLFKLDHKGSVTWVAHFHLIELPNGTVIKHDSLEVSQGEAAKKLSETLSKF